MATQPSFVFAPGAWHSPDCFDAVIAPLSALGHSCVAISFPSVGSSPPVENLTRDVAAVHSAVLAEVEAGNDVTVVSHSWSGIPVNSALDGLCKAEREKEGLKGGVTRLAFIAAFIAPEGISLIDSFGGKVPEQWVIEDDEVTVLDPIDMFYHDLAPAEQNTWAAKLRPHALSTKHAPTTGAAWRTIESVYLLCEDDRAIPFNAQAAMVAAAQDDGAPMNFEVVKTSHSPFLKDPEFVVGFLKRAAGLEPMLEEQEGKEIANGM